MSGPRLRQFLAHAQPHLGHIGAQRIAPHGPAERAPAHRVERGAQFGRTRHRPGAQQRLMLPGPRLAQLVALESIDAGHQEAALAIGAQAHIDLIETSRG